MIFRDKGYGDIRIGLMVIIDTDDMTVTEKKQLYYHNKDWKQSGIHAVEDPF